MRLGGKVNYKLLSKHVRKGCRLKISESRNRKDHSLVEKRVMLFDIYWEREDACDKKKGKENSLTYYGSCE